MIIDYKAWYDKAYWEGKKPYQTPDGKTQLYHGPALAWDGFQYVVDALTPLISGKTLLDIGCGGGDLAARFMRKGYDAYGIDISEHAIKNCVPEMRGRLACGDITDCPAVLTSSDGGPGFSLPTAYDVVLSTDLLEHIYEEDLARTFYWICSRSNRWLFFLVAVTDGPEFVHKKGTPIPTWAEGTAVSGHVNVRRWQWWAKKFRDQGLKIRWDLMYLFQLQRERIKPWKETGGWDMPSTWILEKP